MNRHVTIFPGSDLLATIDENGPAIFLNDAQVGVETSLTALNAGEEVPVHRGEPFKQYQQRYDRNVGGKTFIAQREEDKLFAIKAIRRVEPGKIFSKLPRIVHPNFRFVHEVFYTDDFEYFVYNNDAITLREIEKCLIPLNQYQVVTIGSQILTGIAFLASAGVVHGRLSTPDVYLLDDAELKIGFHSAYEFHNEPVIISPDCKILQDMLLAIMKTGDKNEFIGSNRWSPSLKTFIRDLPQSSVSDLLKHDVLRTSFWTRELVWLIALAKNSASVAWAWHGDKKD